MRYSREFEAYLSKKKVPVKNGMIKLVHADRIASLHHDFSIEKAKKSGLPKSLLKSRFKVIEVSFEELQRSGQKPENFDVRIVASGKNYETGTWFGSFNGTVGNLWAWAIEQCTDSHDPDTIQSLLEDASSD